MLSMSVLPRRGVLGGRSLYLVGALCVAWPGGMQARCSAGEILFASCVLGGPSGLPSLAHTSSSKTIRNGLLGDVGGSRVGVASLEKGVAQMFPSWKKRVHTPLKQLPCGVTGAGRRWGFTIRRAVQTSQGAGGSGDRAATKTRKRAQGGVKSAVQSEDLSKNPVISRKRTAKQDVTASTLDSDADNVPSGKETQTAKKNSSIQGTASVKKEFEEIERIPKRSGERFRALQVRLAEAESNLMSKDKELGLLRQMLAKADVDLASKDSGFEVLKKGMKHSAGLSISGTVSQTSLRLSKGAAEHEESRATASKLFVYIDGASRGNPGPASLGVCIKDEGGSILREVAKCLGKETNNVAEWQAAIQGLKEALELGATDVTLYSDSLLVTNQLTGVWKVNKEHLVPLYRQAKLLSAKFHRFKIKWVPREQNLDADRLANSALDDGNDTRDF